MNRILTFLATQSWLAILWTLGMCVLFFMPTPPSNQESLIPHLDKVVHLGLFAGFIVLWGLYLPKKIGLLVLIAIAFGIVVEYIQEGMQLGRSFDLYDMVADSVGALLGTYILYLLQRFIKKGD